MNKNHRCQCHRNHDKDFTIDPLFFYRSRDGRKIRIYSTSGGGHYPIHGAILLPNGTWGIREWTKDGHGYGTAQEDGDIVGLWIEKPKIDWSNLPKWATHIAIDADGIWYWYAVEPDCSEDSWCTPLQMNYGRIPDKYAPDWQGSWQDSLISREE